DAMAIKIRRLIIRWLLFVTKPRRLTPESMPCPSSGSIAPPPRGAVESMLTGLVPDEAGALADASFCPSGHSHRDGFAGLPRKADDRVGSEVFEARDLRVDAVARRGDGAHVLGAHAGDETIRACRLDQIHGRSADETRREHGGRA